MPGRGDIIITHPEKGVRTVSAGQSDMLRTALDRGWTLQSGIKITHPEKGVRDVAPDQSALLRAALDKGWSIGGGARARAAQDAPHAEEPASIPAEMTYDLTPNQTPATPADETGPSLVTPEAARGFDLSKGVEAPQAHGDTAPASLLAGDADQQLAAGEAIGRFVTSPEYLRAKAQNEAYRRAHDANLSSLEGAGNAALTAAEGVVSAPFLGWDAPAAALEGAGSALGTQAAAAQEKAVYELTGREAPQLTSTRGVGSAAPQPGAMDRLGSEITEAEQSIQGREAVNPKTRFASEVAATALVSGAGGSLGRAGFAVPTVAADRLATKLGVAAARVPSFVGRSIPATLPETARLMATGYIKHSAEGALQGGVQGLADEVNRAWLNEDYDITSERLIASGLQGLEIGAAFGGALGAGAGLAEARVLAKAREGKAPPILLRPETETRGSLRTYKRPEGVKDRAIKLDEPTRKKLVQGAYGDIRDDLNDFVQTRQKLDEVLDLEDKKRWILANADTTPAPFEMVSQIRDELGLDKATLEDLANQGAVLYDNAGGTSAVKRLVNQLDSIENDLYEKAVTQGIHEGDIYIALDQMKRDAAKVVVNARTRNPYLFDVMEPRVNTLIENLKDDKRWSPVLADMQRRTNDTWSRAITSTDDTDLRSMFGELGEHAGANAWARPPKINDSWLDAHLNAIGKPAEAQRIEAVQRYLNTNTDDAVLRAGVYGGTEAKEAAQRLVNARRRLIDRMGTVQHWNANTAESPAFKGFLGIVGQTPVLGWGIAKGLEKLREKAYAQSARTVQQIEAAAKLHGVLQKGVNAGAVKAVREVPPDVKEWLQKLRDGRDDEDKQSMIMLHEALGEPVMDAARAQNARRREFITGKLGSGTPQELRTAERYADASWYPLDALKRISAGTASPEDREAVQTVFPRLWGDFVAKAQENLEKSETTYDQRLRASRLLGVPLVRELDPRYYARMQALAAAPATATPAQSGSAPNTAQLFRG